MHRGGRGGHNPRGWRGRGQNIARGQRRPPGDQDQNPHNAHVPRQSDDVYCGCPWGRCKHRKFHSFKDFYEHVISEQEETEAHNLGSQPIISQLGLAFASNFYIADTECDPSAFSFVCSLCKKKDPGPSQPLQTTLETDLHHINEHYAVPEFYCVPCDVWLSSKTAKDHHIIVAHPVGANDIRDTRNDILHGKQNRSTIYDREFGHLIKQREVDLAKAKSRNRDALVVIKYTERDQIDPTVQAVLQNEHSIASLRFFDGNLAVFTELGDRQFLATLLLASPLNELNRCAEQLKESVEFMLFHSKASSSLVTLVRKTTSTPFIDAFLDAVQKRRMDIQDSEAASTTIRRLITVAPTEDQLKEKILKAIFPGLVFDEHVISRRYASYIMFSIVGVNTTLKLDLARHISLHLFHYATNEHITYVVRYLIRDLAPNPSEFSAASLFGAIQQNFGNLQYNAIGHNVVIFSMWYAPNRFAGAIRGILINPYLIQPNEKTGTFNFKFYPTCQVYQTALVRGEDADIDAFTNMLIGSGLVNEMLNDKEGQNVLRTLAECSNNGPLLQTLHNLLPIEANIFGPDQENMRGVVSTFHKRLHYLQTDQHQ